ncbi:hypothetical protein F4778DRAFT_440044 [Xylariomycetidae sp. FL2044]|nr:hypothetical protein F4778DRAFT_440044 [Xylariomycetidae sp. FL2044]
MEYSPITIRSSSSEDDEKVLAVRTSSEEDEEDEEKDENEAEEEEEVADDDEEDEYEDYKGHEEVLTTTLKGKLKMCLDDIRISGDFAMSAQFNSFPNPGLEVDGSIISLPLTPSDAVKLRAACREAPFGKGDETLVDANVRKTWEWDSSQFHLRNPSWKGFLDDLLRKVVLKLGMSRVRADPYKLLLYENGSFFKRHKDSGKCPGMIGTLVVSLPSEHGGGDVHLSHGGKTRIFPTAPYSSFDLTALAWFSDVTHEIKEVTSGYRLVLTYNLVHIWGEIPSASYYEQQQARLSKILRYVYRKATGVTQLFYLLGYQYTPASLRLEYLKGRDHAVCQALSRACSDQGFWFLLADVTRSLSTDRSGYDYGNSDDNYLEVKVTRDVKGRQISSGDDIDLEDILGFDPYSMRTPDSEDEGEEYTGNESIPPSQRYYDTAAMIIPKRNTAAMFIKAGSHCTNFITMVAEELERQADDPLTRASALRVMNTYLDNGTYLEDKTIALVARWAVTLKDKGLFNKALRTGLSRNSEACILKAIADGINKAFSADESKRPDWDTWLGYLISNPDSLTKLVSMLATVESHLTKAALQEPFAAWRLSALTKAFKSKTHLDTADFEYIKKLVLARRNNLEWIETRPEACQQR